MTDWERGGVVYMLASHKHGTLYTGVTARLVSRLWEHRSETFKSFTRDYGVKLLVWFEAYETITAAIKREKQIKKWNRDWKINLIVAENPNWDDLAVPLFGFDPLPAFDTEATAVKRRHPREGGDPRSQNSAIGSAALRAGSVTLGPRLRGDDERQ